MCSFARSVRPSVGRSVGRSTPPPPRGGRRRRRRSDPVRSGPIGSGARARLPQSLVTSFGSRLPSALAAAAARGREAALPRAARVLHPEVELNKTVRSISRLARPTRSTRPFLTKMPIPPSVCTCRTRVRSHESATVPTREHGREQKKTLRLLRQPTSDQLLSTYIVRAGDLSAYASCLCIIRFSDRSKARRRCRHAAETSHGSSARRSDAGYGRQNFSPRTDLDDRPTLGGKTPPSPGRRVPVDSPEDRRFSNRSKSHRRCRHAMETSQGRSDGRSDAGYGRKKFSPRTDLDDRPTLGGKTPPSPGRRVPVDSPEDRRFSNRSKSHRRCRHAMETSHGRSDGRSDAGYGSRVRLGTVGEAPHCGSRTPDFAVFLVRDSAKDYRRDANAGRRPPLAVSCRRRHRLWDAGDRVSISRRKNFSPRTDLDDRPMLGGKTPPSPGRRVPVDSPEDRRFSNRSKSHRRCRHAMETSQGRSDGRSDAGYGRKNFSPRTDLDDRPTLGGKTPPSPGRRVPVDSPEDRRFSNRSKSRRRCRHAMETSHGRSDGRSDADYGGRVRLGTAGDAPTGFRKNRVNGGSSYDSRTCVYVSSDFHIGQNRVADAGTRRKLRTDVPTDVPKPAMAAGSDSERWGKLLTVGVALRTLPFFWYGIPQKTTGATQTPAGDRRLLSRAGAGTGYGTQATASRYLEEKNVLLEPTSTTGRCSAARPRPRPGDACRSIAPRTDVSQIGPNRIAVAGTPWKLRKDVPTDVPTPVMEEKNFLLEPTSTTGRRSAARPRPRPGDACRSIAPRTDVSQIGPNRVAVAGTPWKLRTDVPMDVPTPTMAAGSDSVRRGMLLRDFAKIG